MLNGLNGRLPHWIHINFLKVEQQIKKAKKGEYGPKFLVTNNFYILKKYNFSDFYALYVSIFADLIEGKKFFQRPWTSTIKLS